MNYLRIFHRKLFGQHLWVTNTVSCGVLFGVGDGIQQNIELYMGVHATGSYDWNRTGRLFVVGITQGPPHHIFYTWLDKVLPQKNMKTIGKKIILDQIIASPFCTVAFFLVVGFLEGKSLAEFWIELKIKFIPIYVADCCLWPPAQALNFYIVPAHYRVIYINVVSVFWDVFLSYMKHRDQLREVKIEKESTRIKPFGLAVLTEEEDI